MSTFRDVGREAFLDISPRSQAVIRAILMEDNEQEGGDLSPILSRTSNRRRRLPPASRNPVSRRFLSSDSEAEEFPARRRRRLATARRNLRGHQFLSSDSGDEESGDLPAGNLDSDEISSNDGIDERNIIPSTSRPRRMVTLLAEQRATRNRQLLENKSNERLPGAFSSVRRRHLPPLATLDDSSSDSENTDDVKRRRAQEDSDYQMALKVSAEVNGENEGRPSSSIAGLTHRDHSRRHSSNIGRRDDSDLEDVQCIICFEVPIRPMGCLHCRQLIGCHACIMKWRRTTNISNLNRMSPLSEGISSVNHRCCPLCRVEWANHPEIAPWTEVQSGTV